MAVKALASVTVSSVADGADGRMLYATCPTAAATAAKVATVSSGTVSLYAGLTVAVQFMHANTAASPSLNVNGTGAKAIFVNGAAITAASYWVAGATLTFVYDGTRWVQADADNVGNVDGRNYVANSATLVGDRLDSTAGSRREYLSLDVGTLYSGLADGTLVTVSFDLVMQVNTVGGGDPYLQVYNSNNQGPMSIAYAVLRFPGAAVGDTIEGRYSVTTSLSRCSDATLRSNYIEFYSAYGTSNWFRVSKLKVEVGSRATAWSPAPEDVASGIDSAQNTANAGIKEQVTLFYAAASATTPSKPTANVTTSNATTYAAWNRTLPTYRSANQYLYVCTQSLTSGGTYSWSAVEPGSYADWAAALGTRLTTAETQITQNASDISLRASKTEIQQLVSRGEQLVINGNGYMGDATNWTGFDFTGSVANGSPGSFYHEGGRTTPSTKEKFPVDPAKTYRFSFDARSDLGTASLYAYVSNFDVDGLDIRHTDQLYSGGISQLTQPLNVGDTVVHISGLANWDLNPSSSNNMGFTFWGYKNKFGYEYPAGTYSRLHSARNIYEASGVNKTAGTVTLKTAWPGPAYPTGTKLSQLRSGANYKYIAAAGRVVPAQWTHYEGVISGTDNPGEYSGTKFSTAVATCGVGFLYNYNNKVDDVIYITNVSFMENNASKEDVTSAANQALADAKTYSDAQLRVQADRITGTVTDVDGLKARTSTLEQTASGLTVSVSKAQGDATQALADAADANANADGVAERADAALRDAQSGINDSIDALSSALTFGLDGLASSITSVGNDLKNVTTMVRVTQRDQKPLLTLGASNSDAGVDLTNESLEFRVGAQVLASASGSAFSMPVAAVGQSISLGGYRLVAKQGGGFSVKWTGV